MVKPTVSDLFAKHNTTDKNTDHSYGPVYDELLDPIRETTGVILELGIGQNGGALRVWKEYFPNAFIIGVDCDYNRMINEDRIISIMADLFDATTLMHKLSQAIFAGTVNLVIDDGPHILDQQMSCMTVLWPLLRSGGLYVIEDASELIHGQIWDGSSRQDNGKYTKLVSSRWMPTLIRLHDNRVAKKRHDDVLYVFQKD